MEKSGNGQTGPAAPKRLKRGVFLAFEGIDGAGKTTQAFVLKDRVEDFGLEAVYVKEPTSGQWGRKIREIASKGRAGVPAEEELDYFIFDREEDVRENIAPALGQNKVVIADRYFYSTIAYQSALGLDPMEIRKRNSDFPVPDMVFLLEIPPSLSQTRITRHRNEKANVGYEQLEYLGLVKKAFDALTDTNLARLDGTLDMATVTKEVWRRVRALLASLLI